MPGDVTVYEHTQSAVALYVAVIACVVVAASPALVLSQLGVIARPVRVVLFCVLGAASAATLVGAIIFSHLTVRVSADRLIWHFTGGLMRRSIALHDVTRAQVVTNPASYGWGYHTIPGGRLYNIAGTRAVALWLQDGSQIRIGSDEPERLLNAIHAAAR